MGEYELGVYVIGVDANGKKFLGKYMDEKTVFSMETFEVVEVVSVEECPAVVSPGAQITLDGG